MVDHPAVSEGGCKFVIALPDNGRFGPRDDGIRYHVPADDRPYADDGAVLDHGPEDNRHVHTDPYLAADVHDLAERQVLGMHEKNLPVEMQNLAARMAIYPFVNPTDGSDDHANLNVLLVMARG